MTPPARGAGHPGPWLVGLSFALAGGLAVALVLADPFLSSLLSNRVWQRLRLEHAPVRATLLIVPALALVSLALHLARKASDGHRLLIVLLTIGMQVNGVRPLGVDLITVLPFVVLLFILAECLVRPDTPVHVTALTFFGALLLLLDLPHMANTNAYGPARFIINFLSFLKPMLVGVVLIMLIRDERDLRLAVRALIVVGVVSAAIGCGQMALSKFTGITFTLANEAGEVKPTFLGTSLRASALTTWAQHLADFQIIVFPFLLYALLRARAARQRLLAAAAVAVSAGGVFFTFTYAAYVGLAVIAVVMPFVVWPHRALHMLLAALLAATMFYMAGGFHWLFDKGLVRFTASSGWVEREVYLQSALAELIRDPWLGGGVYTDEVLSGNFYRKRVHNTGLQAWVYLGLPGFLVFVAMCLTVFTQTWLMATRAARSPAQPVHQCIGVAMIASFLTMFAQPNLTLAALWYTLGLASAAVRVASTGRSLRTTAPANCPQAA